MDTATTKQTQQQALTRRRLRTKGTTRRRSNALGGAVRLNTDAVSAVLTPIYNDLPKTVAAGQHNLTYGEIEWPTLKLIMDYTQKQTWPASGTPASFTPARFYDLGCGRGRAVLYMALAGPFDQSVGIEVLPERVSLAQQALAKLKLSIPSAGAKVRLYEASFLNPSFKYKDARVVFLSNLCFDNETQDALFKKLNLEMPKGSLLFCSREPATPLGAFEKVGVEKVPMTWTPSSEIHILRHL
jgi:SAM-dependent methyltransferase